MAAGRGNHGQFQRLLEMRHLRLISVLGRELNLSRCAEVLHTTQPALSRALAQLEQMIGARLFDRTTRRMSPTSAGLTLIHHADRVLAELDAAETEVRNMPQGVGGELRIGILLSFSAGVAASAIQRTRDLLLGVRIVTHPGTRMGPVASRRQFELVSAAIHLGREEGARLLCGGSGDGAGGTPGRGWFIAPTVFLDVTPSMAVAQNLATPFGGWGQSGWGRENGRFGIEEFLQYRALHIDAPSDGPATGSHR